MTGLLKKDLYVADKSGRLMLVLSLVFSSVPSLGAFGSTYALLLAVMMPLNSIAYDEKCKWDRYAAMLPYRAGQIVWSKYLLSYIFTALAWAILLVGAVIRGILQPSSSDWGETLEMGLTLCIVMVLITAFGLPALYRFGSERGRLVMFLVMGVGVGGVLGLMKVQEELPPLPQAPVPLAAVLGAAAAAGVTLASFRLSVRFYQNRQNGLYDE